MAAFQPPLVRYATAAVGLGMSVCLSAPWTLSWADPPAVESSTRVVRGVVVDPEGRGLSWVYVYPPPPGTWVRTDDSGVFELKGVPAGKAEVRAYLWGGPQGEAPVVKAVPADSSDVRIVMERGPQLTIARSDGPFVEESRGLAILVLDSPKGRVRYSAALESGAAVFRRVKSGLPWTLWVPWSGMRKGTLYETGSGLAPGRRVVTLQSGKTLSCRVNHYADRDRGPDRQNGPPWESVLATRGAMEEWGQYDKDGNLLFPPMASGAWRVRARFWSAKHGGAMEAVGDMEAGAPLVVLEPVAR
jgi:hypothetical protein